MAKKVEQKGVLMARVVGNGTLVEETSKEMMAFFKKRGRVHYVVMGIRPGVGDCLRLLELTHYAPGTVLNDLFVMRYITWGGLEWYIVSLPKSDAKHMESAAAANGLKVSVGVPMILSCGAAMRFPISGKNVFTLENTSKHPVYKRS